ncbi:MAG: hypothetical protein Barrevirus4_1, partial [Barrevirus sp.]
MFSCLSRKKGKQKDNKDKKVNRITIDDYEKVKIPKDYTLIKMISYNINLSHSVNLDKKIKEVISYMTSNYYNKSIDIINLQEINDIVSLNILVEEFKRFCLVNNLTYYYSPPFNNILPTSHSHRFSHEQGHGHSHGLSIHMIEKSFDSRERVIGNKNKKIIHNIIISKFPIISTIYSELNTDSGMEDILGTQVLVGANILIGNSIISVFNVTFSKDVVAAQLNNREIRGIELITMLKIINNNSLTLKNDSISKYTVTHLNLITGTFNIPEIESDGKVNDEYDDILSVGHFLDIFRLISEDYGFTTTFKERINYVFLYMSEDFYKGSSYSDTIVNGKSVVDKDI